MEILVAIGLLGVGLAALMQTLPMGIQGIATGRQQSTAIFLANQRLEEARAWNLDPSREWDSVVNCCPDEDYGAIAGYGNYKRAVTFTSPTTNTRLITVTVSYRPVSDRGVEAGDRRVTISTVIACRSCGPGL